MITRDVRGLLAKANPHLMESLLDQTVAFTRSRQNAQVTLEHLLLVLLEAGDGDIPKILRHFGVDPGSLQKRLLHSLETFSRGHQGKPGFSQQILDLLERAFLIGILELDQDRLRSGVLLLAGVEGDPAFFDYMDYLEGVTPETLRRDFDSIVSSSVEERAATGRYGAVQHVGKAAQQEAGGVAAESALGQFTLDITALARDGEMDPVLGRDEEIRQMLDILTRRRKNNPILVGEAGVGKTALVEGLALRVAAGDVPSALAGIEIRSLDLGLLQAGAGVKGEFENRLKSVIAEIRESPVPIVTFIDEAHTLIGAGGDAGQGDAANLLKPALARGELRTIAATTWSEYKKYFEKDAALARRFQLVKVDEPDEHRAVVMMRGLAPKLEDAHGVRVLDSAVVAAVRLSQRYLAGRQLPDKSVDLLDTAAARVKIGLSSKPAAIEDLERTIENAERALLAQLRDAEDGVSTDAEEIHRLEVEIKEAEEALVTLSDCWESEKAAVEAVLEARGIDRSSDDGEESEDSTATSDGGDDEPDEANGSEEAPRSSEEGKDSGPEADGDSETESSNGAERSRSIARALEALHDLQGQEALIPLEVNPDVIAAVVSDWTGIPAGKMQRDRARSVLDLETNLVRRVVGQDAALKIISERLRAANAGLGAPEAPQGVFLLVGPSGVGKTETALALADRLFGGERFMTGINMSEYMEAHTVSRLIGSPPGYVGYGEGGVLTEAVRQRPYSVVLLDEVEKGHPDVMNLFYQVFDKGILADGEGREIDFRNTVIVMTSNLASDAISQMCEADEPSLEELEEAIRPELRERFKPALLARMTVLPYLPLDNEALRLIVDLKLRKIRDRLASQAQIALQIEDDVANWVTTRCIEEAASVGDSGARYIDHLIQSRLLPRLSVEILERMANDEPARSIRLYLDAEGELTQETR